MSDDAVDRTDDIIAESAKLLRGLRTNEDATRRQLEAGRTLVEHCRRLLRKLRAGDRADVADLRVGRRDPRRGLPD